MRLEDFNAPLELVGSLQEYSWGKGTESQVAKFSSANSSNGKYAELWFGAHPSKPSAIVDAPINLLELIQNHKNALLGEQLAGQYATLPFLFKILSVDQPLSIQAHPDIDHARSLHDTDPEHYPDPFPKPEVGIAITEVEILYGFRSLEEIKSFLQKGDLQVPELCDLIGEDLLKSLADSEENLLKELYHRVVSADQLLVANACQSLWDRLKRKKDLTRIEQYIIELENIYPDGDNGIFSFFLLNLVTLDPGQALYIGPNIVHAYLSGELYECMAPSDNVVRAGLTNKFVDKKTLLNMLQYNQELPGVLELSFKNDSFFQTYDLPLEQYFEIQVIKDSSGLVDCINPSAQLLFCATGVPSLVAKAGSYELSAGKCFFIPALVDNYQLKLESDDCIFIITGR